MAKKKYQTEEARLKAQKDNQKRYYNSLSPEKKQKNLERQRIIQQTEEYKVYQKTYWKKFFHEHPKYSENRRKNGGREIDDRSRLKRLFKITIEDYHELLNIQNNVCAICGQPETAKNSKGEIRPLGIDHDHKTGLVRGLLCHKCNVGLGCYNDSPELLDKAKEYLNIIHI